MNISGDNVGVKTNYMGLKIRCYHNIMRMAFMPGLYLDTENN